MTEQASIPAPTAPPPTAPARTSIFRKAALLVAIAIVALDLGNLALLALKSLDRPQSAASGTLLYATSFDAYNEEWSQFEGQMSSRIGNGSLRVEIDTPGDGAYSVLNHDIADFDMRVNASQITSTDDLNQFGVLFGYQDVNNYYIFKITGDGNYLVDRVKDGKTQTLSPRHPSAAILAGTDQVNQLRVIGKGSHFQFFVNDQPLTLCLKGSDKQPTWAGDQCISNNKQTSSELVDSTFTYGKVGVGVYAFTAGEVVGFDNVLIYAP